MTQIVPAKLARQKGMTNKTTEKNKMPLPLSTLTMEAIATTVDKWRRNEITARQALTTIDKLIISFQKVEWAQDH